MGWGRIADLTAEVSMRLALIGSSLMKPRPFFDWLVLRLEALMYEISQSSRSSE